MAVPNRRRKYFIDKRLQGMWALLNLAMGIIIAILIGLELSRSFFAEFGWPLVDRPFALPDVVYIVKLIILAILGGGFFWLLSAFAGHRIAGPVFKLNHSMKEVAKGNYSLRIQFRKKDFFHDVAETFNEMVESLENEFNTKEKIISRIKEKVRTLPKDNKEAQELKALLQMK